MLSHYDPSARSTLQSDASQYGPGTYLLKKGKLVAYVSRNLLLAEYNYAQVKKELLAFVFATQTRLQWMLLKLQ